MYFYVVHLLNIFTVARKSAHRAQTSTRSPSWILGRTHISYRNYFWETATFEDILQHDRAIAVSMQEILQIVISLMYPDLFTNMATYLYHGLCSNRTTQARCQRTFLQSSVTQTIPPHNTAVIGLLAWSHHCSLWEHGNSSTPGPKFSEEKEPKLWPSPRP